MKCSSIPKPLHGRQRGLSLIELMVAMVIGCFLILGVTQIFISNQKSYLFQQGQVGNQENGRFALGLLAQELSKAGYRSNILQPLAANSTLSGCDFVNENVPVLAVSATTLCIQYQASNRADVTCQGTALSAASKAAIATPYGQKNPVITEKIAFDGAAKAITCTTGGNTVQLVTGVQDLRFEYGAGDTGEKNIKVYGVSPAGTVRMVRYSVLMQSPGNNSLLDTTDISPALKEWNTRYGTTYNDTKSIYQIVQGTFMVRNQMP
jgi:type IV pilus assembly protein PilW